VERIAFSRRRRALLGLVPGALLSACSPRARRDPSAVVFKHGKIFGESRVLRDLLDRFETETGLRVVEETLPSSTDLQHQYFITTLEGGSADVDVLSMDVIWVPEFSRAGWLLDLSHRLPPVERDDFFRGPLDACTYGGGLYGVPWYVDGGVLYYRKDLLEARGIDVPGTFADLARATERILESERNAELEGFVWQGKQYEGLVCFGLELLSSFGGRVLSPAGEVRIDSAEAREAFRFLRSLLDRGVSPELVATADEETTRRIFNDGRAVFLRNWFYAWNLFENEGSPVRGKTGLAPIPPGESGLGGSTLGGWQLGITRDSPHPDESWALVEFLTRPESQAYLTRRVGYRPSRPSLYREPELTKQIPVLSSLLPILESAHPRPVTPLYLAVSETLQAKLSAIVAGIEDVDDALSEARSELEFILAGDTDRDEP
jgi:trehalose/maltose transport system substrate-binding protein